MKSAVVSDAPQPAPGAALGEGCAPEGDSLGRLAARRVAWELPPWQVGCGPLPEGWLRRLPVGLPAGARRRAGSLLLRGPPPGRRPLRPGLPPPRPTELARGGGRFPAIGRPALP